MPEQLLSRKEVASRLGVSLPTFYAVLPRLKALGLQEIKIGRCRRFRQSTFEKALKRLAEREEHLTTR